ncbi:dynein axonemal heavy chain 8 isoform X1 [Hydra vulgaris]|uniref:dynein axonemal heavy chain 8 isoform X1 n=1 Tax=Hydra vulgaris TaxID=6087 RepID=UPI001F5F6EEF|nr:dynein axonemal heavy chain 8 [Hydra vulgaris]
MAEPSKSPVKLTLQNEKNKLSANNKNRKSIVTTTEYRERQNKLKARKEVLKARFTDEHKFILSMVAFELELSEEIVFDFAVESEEGVKLFDNFIEANGRRTLIFFYQDSNEDSRIEVSSRSIQSSEPKELFITDGFGKPLTGLLLYFVKSSTKALKLINMHEEVCFGSMDCSNGCGILKAISQCMSRVYTPALNALEKWGDLDNTSQGLKARDQFLKSMTHFNHFVEVTSLALCNSIELKKCESINICDYTCVADYYKIVNNPEEITYLEDLVKAWCKQIEQILAESEQMRKEADDTGPIAELEHWRQRRAKFNTLLDQIRHPQCKTVIIILVLAKSKVIKIWKELNNRITDSANEAKDNVKYLDTIERSCEPLYESDPSKMITSIAKLISAIQIIHSTSQYYNTPQRMTSLFIKVTNQMVTACKDYITERNKEKIWDQPRQSLIEKLNICNQLNKEYQLCFQRTKKKIEGNPHEKPFEFSEMYIFGKFDTFCRRTQKIIELIRYIETYSILHESKIEGIDAIAVRFETIYKNIKKKPYDILDHRKVDFDHDFDDFKRYIGEIDSQLQIFIDDCFEKTTSTVQALQLLARFEKLMIPSLNDTIDYKYDQLFMQFGAEIIKVGKLYEKYKEDPPISRVMPPIAGKISWARQLTYSIREPMSYFETRQSTLSKKDALKVVHMFNKVAQVLLQFEMVYLDAWCKDVNTIKLGLQVSLLVRYEDTFLVNFDPLISQLIRETDCLIKMGVNVPESALSIFKRKEQLKEDYYLIKSMIDEYCEIKKVVLPIFLPMMRPYLNKIEARISPGLTMLSWNSLRIHDFVNDVHTHLKEFKVLNKQVMDIHDARIDLLLEEIINTELCEVPIDKPWTIEEFETRTTELCNLASIKIERNSSRIEEAVFSIIEILNGCYQKLSDDSEISNAASDQNDTSPKKITWKKKCLLNEENEEERSELINIFNNKLIDALLRCIRNSLDVLKRRFQGKSYNSNEKNSSYSALPFFKADIVLSIPNVIFQPSIDDIQQVLNKCYHSILEVCKNVHQWSQVKDSESAIPKSKNFYKYITDHKDVNKLLVMLSSAISSTKADTNQCIDYFNKFDFLWKADREGTIKNFMLTDPILSEFKAEIIRYQDIEQSINEIPNIFYFGHCTIQLNSEPIKVALKVEAQSWKLAVGQALNSKYSSILEEIVSFIADYSRRLTHPIQDLDDIRFVMAALSDIRENEIRLDMSISPIEETYSLLNRFAVQYNREESEKVDSLRYSVKKLLSQASGVQTELVKIQPKFRDTLLESVEVFKVEQKAFTDDYLMVGPMVHGITPQEASDRLALFQIRFDDLWRKYQTYSGGEELFGIPLSEYPQIIQIKKELGLLQKLYGLYNAVIETVNSYYDILWHDVDIEKINTSLLDFQSRCRRLPKALNEWDAYIELNKKINDFNECCPLLEMMADKAIKQRHWDRMEGVTGHHFDVDSENFSLRNIMEAPLLKHKEDIEDICISAVKEKDIEAKLSVIVSNWTVQEFTFGSFKARGELLLKGANTTDIIALLEDSLMILGSLMSNRYNAPFKKEIQTWVYNLSNTSDIIESWMVVQNLWIYLEAVFVGGDIAKQLPKEAKRFQGIDKSWVKIMARAHETPNVVQCCVGDETMGQLLPHLHEQLELCQKSLTGYLEKKRLLFPRFFFISDPSLLEILGQASDSHTIQTHLLGIFDNTKNVGFHPQDYDRIISIISSEGETVQLDKHVVAKGNVEVWLLELLNEAQHSLHNVIRDASIALKDPGIDIMNFFNTFVSQVGLLGIQMIWTRDAEEALENSKQNKLIMKQTNQAFLVLLNSLIDVTIRDLTKVERTKFETLVTIHVHQRDIFDDLVKMHAHSTQDFDWLKQSRFYFHEDTDKCIVSITNVNFEYQNEFLGCTDRLVITPLTDRCYITIAQALGMSMGAAPAGPAGTGKTETVKDMGKALGKYVVVFNCSDQMDFRGLGRIYKGLAQAGAWGCFDEFNRIELPVLSVAAQQIYIILTAKKERKKEFVFSDGDVVELNTEFGIFLTMNPGYAGRQELPENLKVQFRTVAMMVPDRQIIMRVKLAACGFLENVILAQKFYTLYKLCEEQLTKQVHYDFGLRNILSVLRTLGSNKRLNPTDSESTTVMRVLRDMNLSKLVDEDAQLFLSLIDDLFPGIKLEKAGYPQLESFIQKNVEDNGFIFHPPWVLKVIQLFETQRVRHGLMCLGPSGAGKSVCITMLMKALGDQGEPHREMRMNPKAITAPQMFGRLDASTNDWTDGIFSTLWRKTLKTKPGEKVWLILDGPVDAIWIENLNSVLDDNKTLTLANGDRIVMSPQCKILFEVHNIDNASPATVSRVGMVFMSSSILNWKPVLQGWLRSTRAPTEAEAIQSIFDNIFDGILVLIYQSLNPKMDLLQINIVKQAIDLMEGLIPNRQVHGLLPTNHLNKLIVFSIMWSAGALLELDDRVKMEHYLRSCNCLDLPQITEGSQETIFEYVIDKNGDWEHWRNRVEEYIYPSDSKPSYSSILVPNVDNVCIDFLTNTIAKQGKAVLLIGEQGTAKTVTVKGYTNKYDIEQHMSKSFSFSSATTPDNFQRTIESYVDKRVGSTYGPPAGRKMTVFIDDINMPAINAWGDQITNEITRQAMEAHGFYNLDKPGEFTSLVDIQFIGAMIHPGGGRNDIPQRLKRQFSIFNCTLPSNASIDKIFGVIGCGWFCSKRFGPDIADLTSRLVSSTRILWQRTKIKMLPTPAKFHYVFNLRDLSRIWEGMLNSSTDSVTTVKSLINLWKHECTRVIADRFANSEDKSWFEKALCSIVEENFPEFYDLMDSEPYFVDFLRDAPEATGEESDDASLEAPKIYEQVSSLDILSVKLTQSMAHYNEVVRGGALDLVFFKDAMTHLVKISRIIRTPRGNAILVGVGGSGKQSLTRLASYIAGYQIFQITLTRSYNQTNLVDDLKILYRVAGAQGKGITFLFTDNEIKSEGFLEYINNVLSSGEVSNLFAKDELDEITNNLVSVMKKEYPRVPPTQDNLYQYFISRAKNNLHVVLCFSPVGDKFRSRALKFPGLISGCTMDWFSRWPKDALIAVADYFLSKFDIECTVETKRSVVETMGVIHDGVAQSCNDYFERFRRQTYVTPKSYLSFIDGYKNIYIDKKSVIGELAGRMKTGLDKLIEATDSVAKLAKELVVKEKGLIIASGKADKVLKEVTVKAQIAEKIKADVQKVKDKAQSLVEDINVDKGYAMKKLEAAAPALAEAENALLTIKPAHISTVRKLAKPPHLIMRIMDAVSLLFRRPLIPVIPDPNFPCPTPSWTESLKLMSSATFLQGLVQFDKDTITEEIVELLEPYLNMADYTFDGAKKSCSDVAGLLSWTKAMSFFYGVNKEVLPLKANLIVQEAKLKVAQGDLDEAQGVLNQKQAELDEVQAMYDAAMNEKQELLDDAIGCKKKMEAASALIDGLGGERVRWIHQSKEFQEAIGRLVGDVLLATGFLSYSGPFNQVFRTRLNDKWQSEMKKRKIPYTENINLSAMLVDNATISEWNIQGLPNDDLSIQNGIIVTKATRYPLLIDPQTQGKSWIKNKERCHELQVSSLNHKYFRIHLEDCLSLGKPLLLEDIGEELDPALDNVLEKNFIKSGSTYKVKVGDKECDVMNGFVLYMTTKLGNPLFTPEVYARTAIIDFTVTIKGLEDQLLGRVINTEKQELEGERLKLMVDVAANKRKMKDLEDNLLFRLTSTKGSLVEDESLVAVLRTTKETAQDVSEKLINAGETEIKINKAREEFRTVATRGSILYFLVVEMSMVNKMYQIALQQFLNIFDMSMAKSEKSPIPAKRISNITEFLTFEVYKFAVRGLYEKDKFMFTLLLSLKIDIGKGSVKTEEFSCFIKGGAALDLKSVQPKPYKWISDMTWLNLVQLSKLPTFSGILDQVSRNESAWKSWLDKDNPEEHPIPDGYQTSLDTFKKLLLIRSWCPDRTLSQARNYISESMGEKYAEGVIFNIETLWEESDIKTPLICLLSMGSDPTSAIEGLAKRFNIECRAISMGQGQDVHARKLLQQSSVSGGWVLLQNCHLGLDFTDELLEYMLSIETAHSTFRLWITTEEHAKFPIGLLQCSIKFTNQPPQGIKAGLKRTYANVSQDQLDICSLPQWKPMLFAVAFLHTVVQERRKFGPLGWNIPYEFNQSDLTATVQFVQNHLDDSDSKSISWETVRYMIGEVQYGGRVTDDYDKRLLITYAKVWFTDELFKEDFSFFKGYNIPRVNSIFDYREKINLFPNIDSPEVYGLHANADITYQTNTTRETLETILNIQPKDSGTGTGETREQVVTKQAIEMLSKLPSNYVSFEVRARLQKMGALTPLNIFLGQEIDRMQRVITLVRNTLTDLQLAIEGTIIMSENLRNALDNMFDARVPTLWQKISWQSSTLGFWFTELIERNQQFSTWIFNGRPKVFWMTGFFNPPGFLTAMRQEVTRMHKGWALDSVILHNDVLKQMKEEITASPQEGVYVYGLYLEGSSWDRKNCKLVDSSPKTLFTALPVVHIYAINNTSLKDPRLYMCPVYKKPKRTDLTYITALSLRTTQNPDYWIMRGVALLCDIK